MESEDTGLLGLHWFEGGYAESLLHFEKNIRIHENNKTRYKGSNLNCYNVSIAESPNELSIKAKIPALRYEKHSPSDAEIFPHVL